MLGSGTFGSYDLVKARLNDLRRDATSRRRKAKSLPTPKASLRRLGIARSRQR
jgi:hypothetical protein